MTRKVRMSAICLLVLVLLVPLSLGCGGKDGRG